MEKKCYTGYHTVEELLKQKGIAGTLVFSKENRKILSLVKLARIRGIRVVRVSADEIDRICGSKKGAGSSNRGNGHTGRYKKYRDIALVLTKIPEGKNVNFNEALERVTKDTALILVLNEITDPQNFGAILRSADQLSVDLVVVSSRKSAGENETVVKVSSGASVYVPVAVVANIGQAIEKLKKYGFWVYGADMAGTSILKTNLKGKTAIVMGSEGGGLHRLIRERCDALISIPSFGHVDSFNVSVAAAIIMYETRRQQGFFNV